MAHLFDILQKSGYEISLKHNKTLQKRRNMTAKSHTMSAMLVGLYPVLSGYVPLEYSKFYLIGLIIGSLWPDLDEPESYLGRRVYIISLFLSIFTKHRGITHTVIALVIYAIVAYVLYLYRETFNISTSAVIFSSIGFLLGNFIHILGDMCTKEGGIALLYPISKKRFYLTPEQLRFKTAGITESVIVTPTLTAGVIWQAAILYQSFKIN